MSTNTFAASCQAELLHNPPIIESTDGLLQLTLKAGVFYVTVLGQNASLQCFNATQIPPTLKLKRGDTLNLIVINDLPNGITTNVHFHGLTVTPIPPGDNVLFVLPGGMQYQYLFTIPRGNNSKCHLI